MGSRSSRKKRAPKPARPPSFGETVAPPSPPEEAAPEPAGGDRMKRGYARSEERNEEARRRLEPLKPGERPGAVTIAAIVAAVLGLANLGLLLGQVEVRGEEPDPFSVVTFALIMFGAAIGMWKAKYWAVLGFQALLLITMLIAFVSLAVAGNAAALILCAVVLIGSGWLFYKLIRAMARLQMPVR
jgi:hypothetical protein